MVRGATAGAIAVAIALAASSAGAQESGTGVTCRSDEKHVRCGEVVTVRPEHPADWQPVASSSLSADELRAFGSDTQTWLDLAKLSAGTSLGTEQMYANGLPLRTAPPAARVSRVSVNADPFSVEQAGVDQLRMDIDLQAPDRRWRFNAGLPSLNRGGASPIVSSRSPSTRQVSGGAGGPLGQLPITFAVQGNRSATTSQPVFVDAGALTVSDQVLRESSLANVTGELAYAAPRLQIHAMLMDSRITVMNAGVGGIVSAEAGHDSVAATRTVQTTWRVTGTTWRQRGGVSWIRENASMVARAADAAVVVPGQSIGGGNTVAEDVTGRRTVALTHVFESPATTHRTVFGVFVQGDEFRDESTPNPNGRWLADRSGATIARQLSSRVAPVHRATSTASGFAERVVVARPRLTVRTGARADWQAGDGWLVSPRASLATTLRGARVTAGAGLFADTWSADLLSEIQRRDAAHERTVVSTAKQAFGLTTVESPSFRRRRDLRVSASLQRPIGPWRLGVEQSWTQGFALGGSVRALTADGLVDTVASDRRLHRHQTQVRAGLSLRRVSASVSYEHASSIDNTAGLFALPAHAGDVAGEWAPSSFVSRHYASAVLTLVLPKQVRASLTGSWRAGLPLNIISGMDPEGLFTFNDRGGLPRNAGTVPAVRNLSLYVARRLTTRLAGTAIDLGARVDNAAGWVNTSSVGAVMGTRMFGQPLGTAPGRSARVWIAFTR